MTLSSEKTLRDIAVLLAGDGADGATSSEHALEVIRAAVASAHPSGGGAGGVQVATVEVSSAEILDLHNTRKQLLAAPGAGRRILPIALFSTCLPGSAYYNIAFDPLSNLRVQFDSPVSPIDVFSLDVGHITAFPDPQTEAGVPAGVNGALNNQPLFLTNLGGPITDGNGTLLIVLVYLLSPAA